MKFLKVLSLTLGALILSNSMIATPPHQQVQHSLLSTVFSSSDVQKAAQRSINDLHGNTRQEAINVTSEETPEVSFDELITSAKAIAFGLIIPGIISQNIYTRIIGYPYMCWHYGAREATQLFIIDGIKSLASSITGRQNLIGNSMPGLKGLLTRFTISAIVSSSLRTYISKPFTDGMFGVEPTPQEENQPELNENETMVS